MDGYYVVGVTLNVCNDTNHAFNPLYNSNVYNLEKIDWQVLEEFVLKTTSAL